MCDSVFYIIIYAKYTSEKVLLSELCMQIAILALDIQIRLPPY